jgi:hypothetical protein
MVSHQMHPNPKVKFGNTLMRLRGKYNSERERVAPKGIHYVVAILAFETSESRRYVIVDRFQRN